MVAGQLVAHRALHLQSMGLAGPGEVGLEFQPFTCASYLLTPCSTVAYPGFFFGGGSTNSVEDRGQREWGSGGGSSLVRGSGGSCKLVQEISFHMVKFS